MVGQIRDINRLNWYVKEKYLELEERCKKRGVKIVVFETVRSDEYQLHLWNYGRLDKTKPIVTNMKKPVAHSESIAIAFDIYVEISGKAIWDGSHPHWKIVLEIAKEMGFTCGHYWKMRDTCHFQLDGGLSTKELLAGKRPSWFYDKPTPQQPNNPFETLKQHKIIGDTFDWEDNCKSNNMINGVYCKALMNNFFKTKTKLWSFTFTQVLDYLVSEHVISDVNYWSINTLPNGKVDGGNVKIVIERMSKLI